MPVVVVIWHHRAIVLFKSPTVWVEIRLATACRAIPCGEWGRQGFLKLRKCEQWKWNGRKLFLALPPIRAPFTFSLFMYQLLWTQACTEGMCTNGTQVPCEVPSLPNPTNRKGWPHHQGVRPLLFSNSDVGSFTSHNNKSVKVLWNGTYGFSSLCKKTRKSNQLQMSLQRQHFLLSYLKTLSVGPAGVWSRDIPLGRSALSQLSYLNYLRAWNRLGFFLVGSRFWISAFVILFSN